MRVLTLASSFLLAVPVIQGLDLDTIFDEVNDVNSAFRDILRVLPDLYYRRDGAAQKLANVTAVLGKATHVLDATVAKIGSDSKVEDFGDVIYAFCDDMESFDDTQIKAANVLAANIKSIRGARLAKDMTALSSAYSRYASAMIPLTNRCEYTRSGEIAHINATLSRATAEARS